MTKAMAKIGLNNHKENDKTSKHCMLMSTACALILAGSRPVVTRLSFGLVYTVFGKKVALYFCL